MLMCAAMKASWVGLPDIAIALAGSLSSLPTLCKTTEIWNRLQMLIVKERVMMTKQRGLQGGAASSF